MQHGLRGASDQYHAAQGHGSSPPCPTEHPAAAPMWSPTRAPQEGQEGAGPEDTIPPPLVKARNQSKTMTRQRPRGKKPPAQGQQGGGCQPEREEEVARRKWPKKEAVALG